MIITPQALRGIYTAFNTVFNKAFEGQHPTYEKVATVVPSTSESETYAWLGDIPGMREWIGEREIQNLSGSAYTIKNKDFELTVGVDRNAVEDDKIGLYNPSIQMLGESAALHPDELMINPIDAEPRCIPTSWSTVCWPTASPRSATTARRSSLPTTLSARTRQATRAPRS